MGVAGRIMKALGEMDFNSGGRIVNWYPGHMAVATRAIRDRLKIADLVIEVRDARIPISSANVDLQPILGRKRRLVALNKKDLANSNILRKWIQHFDMEDQSCIPLNAHNRSSVEKLLHLAEIKLKESISKEPTLLIMVVGVPNVGKSVLINSISRIASSKFPVQEKRKRAEVGPLPGVTQDIAGYKIAHRPSIYVLDTPGVLVPSIPDIETGLKLALTGSVKDSVVGEERIVEYLLGILNTRGTPILWGRPKRPLGEDPSPSDAPFNLRDLLPRRKPPPSDKSDGRFVRDMAAKVRRALYTPLSGFEGDLEDENELERLIEDQFRSLQLAMNVPLSVSDARTIVSKKLLALFRAGLLGPFIFDHLPSSPSSPPAG